MGRLNYVPIEGNLVPKPTVHLLALSRFRAPSSMPSANQHSRVRGDPIMPTEIILLIAEELLAAGRVSDLAAMSLLGRDYAPAIQRILLRHIHVTTYDHYTRLMRTFRPDDDSPERGYVLASLVHGLSVTLGPHSYYGEVPLGKHHLSNLCDVLPRLRFVDLTEITMIRLGRSLVPAEEDFNRIGALESLRSITLTDPLGPVGGLMVMGLPCLEEINLFGQIPTSLFSFTSPRSGHSLRRLTWGCTTPPTLQRIRWAFGQSNDVVEGKLVLHSRPESETELNAIRQYVRQRNIAFVDNSV
ncbi:hypothetical protein RSOLAG1IB_07509 [Rhizoctonia solani AG-1 IB]|uniref:Uncharacterized protein n=1 Tax=Thanatephorus cucumeris (strain AG1-IB / isolate 7/3/14) TaxID=1108050 RepID=A0A0B7FDG0_THACB|nr:hypothetical protein RSOLAG1IB_07509 [Rhizoctonia solani AG-1 IB]